MLPEKSPMKNPPAVQLRAGPQYVWTCPVCTWLNPACDVPVNGLGTRYDFDAADPDRTVAMAAPKEVTCAHCGTTFPVTAK